MRFSVVINTFNRAASLRTTLDALRHQTYTDFEVVVVDGPSDDGTPELLAARADAIRTVRFEERNLSKSRNLGIDASAGDVVAFIDDDAIPEARWLEQLAAAYVDERVGGAGGLVLDNTGVRPQYRYSLCDRMGRTDFDAEPPFATETEPGADPFVYLQGTNCSFRRTVLEAIEGFDEEIEYNYDEAELCACVIDAGYRIEALSGAVVHHHFLPSHLRRAEGFTDPFLPIKNRVYVALRMGRDFYSTVETLTALTKYLADAKAHTADAVDRERFTEAEGETFDARADAGFALGLERGLAGVRKGRPIALPDPDAFLPYPVLVPNGRRLAVCFASLEYPPKPLGGVGRYTHDLARGFAAAGHEAHVVTRDDEQPYRLDFEEGVWVHRFPVTDRWVPELAGHPLKGLLDHQAAVRSAVERIAARVPFDVVTGSSWVAEPLLCALDGGRAVSAVCVTPLRTIAASQPVTAASPLTDPQIAAEDALLRSPAFLQPISHEVAKLLPDGVDAEVVHLGTADHRRDFTRRRDDDGVEILYAGRLEPRKGVDTLLEAGAEVLRAHPEARLRLVGSDNPGANGAPDHWPAWVREHAADVADRIRFDGHVDDAGLLQAYADCDVFCAPSRYESFGLVHVEAMMMGRPVIGCDIGGMRETIVDGETGRLVPVGDAPALRDALAALVGDAEARERMGAAGRARYETEFGLDVAVARHVLRFQRLADERPAPGDLPALLGELCDLEPGDAVAAAAALRDPTRFPVDYEAGVRRALVAADPELVVDGLFRTLLGRAPEESGLAGYVPRVVAGEDLHAIAYEIATSPEARARGGDRTFLDRLPRVSLPRLQGRVTGAWLHDDDEAFRAALSGLVEDDEPPPLTGDREAYVRALLARPDVQRLAEVDDLAWLGALRTESQLVDEINRGSGDVAPLYRVLLGREAAAGELDGYRGRDLADAVRSIGDSAEAAVRGIPATAVASLAERAAPRRPGLRARIRRVVGADETQAAVARSQAAVTDRVDAVADRVDAADHGAALVRVERVVGALDRQVRDGLAVAQSTTGDLRHDTAEGTAALAALQRRIDVLLTKQDALALDLREKLPSTAPAEAPDPEVPDPEALARRIEALGAVRLNLGAGEKPLDGYLNVDLRALPGVDVIADARRLPFEPGTVAEIASHHLIEHFREHQVETVLLPYWRSLLVPGGVLRTVTPNWEVMLAQLDAGRLSFQEFKLVTFGGQDYAGDDHFALYSPATLTALLERAGFGGIEVLVTDRQNGLSPEMELVAHAPVAASVARPR